MTATTETREQEVIINELLSVSRSLADWARSEFRDGETAHGITKRLREALMAIEHAAPTAS